MFTRALILGATGMLGCHAVHAALRRGLRVRALVRPGSPARILEDLEVEIARGDLLDPASLRAAFEGCDLVVQAAAPYPKRHFGKPALLREAAAGMEHWLGAARACGTLVRAIYVSSVTTIGRAGSGPARETAAPAGGDTAAAAGGTAPAERRAVADPAAPLLARETDEEPIAEDAPYFAVKARMEAQAMAAARAGLPLIVVNPTFCVDEFDDHRTTAQLLVPLAKGQLPAYIPGRINAVATRDVGEGILLAAERGRIGERYILGGENTSSREFLERCARVAGVRPPRLAFPVALAEGLSCATEVIARLSGTRPLFPLTGVRMIKRGQHYDTTKAESELGYAATDLDSAIERAYRWYRLRGMI